MRKRLMVLGAGGNVYDLLDTIEAINKVAPTWEMLGILDDRRSVGIEHLGIPILGKLSDAAKFNDCSFVSSIWNEEVSHILQNVLTSTGLAGLRFATILHPSAFVSRRAQLAHGVVMHQAASIAGNVTIGEHVSIGPGCIVGHDTTMTGFTAVAAGAVIGGSVRIGRNCYIGSGSLIRQHVEIGNGSVIGMGAVVVRDVPAGTTVVGNPARPLARTTDQRT